MASPQGNGEGADQKASLDAIPEPLGKVLKSIITNGYIKCDRGLNRKFLGWRLFVFWQAFACGFNLYFTNILFKVI